MPGRAALVTALIFDRPLCMACLRDRTGFSTPFVEATLKRIQKMIAVEREEARCRGCGTNGRVYAVHRPSETVPLAADARCAVCGGPIRYGEPTVVVQDSLVHEACYRVPSDAVDLVAEFLRKTPKSAYCNICLASICKLPYEKIAKATARLRGLSEFRVLIGGRCYACQRPRVTVGVRPSGEPGSSDG